MVRRYFNALDTKRSGAVPVNGFQTALQQCGVELSDQQMYHILELLDPQLTGVVDYQQFFDAILEL